MNTAAAEKKDIPSGTYVPGGFCQKCPAAFCCVKYQQIMDKCLISCPGTGKSCVSVEIDHKIWYHNTAKIILPEAIIMARKTKEATAAKEKRDFQKICAFWGLAIAAVLFIVAAVINLIGKFAGIFDSDIGATIKLVMNIFELLSKLFILLAVALPAYSYVRGKKKGWKIFYWIALAVYVLCVVFDIIAIA